MSGGTGVRRLSDIKSGQDLLCGILYILVGVIGLYVARDYSMGTATRLGTGVFPTILCWGMIGSGVIVLAKAFMAEGEKLTPWAWRPVLLISLGTILFSFLIDTAGLVIAMTVLMICGALAGRDHKWGQTAIFMVIMVGIGVGLFIWGLGMPIKVLPWS